MNTKVLFLTGTLMIGVAMATESLTKISEDIERIERLESKNKSTPMTEEHQKLIELIHADLDLTEFQFGIVCPEVGEILANLKKENLMMTEAS